MSRKIVAMLTLSIALFVLLPGGRAQSQAKPLTNSDIVKMTKSGLAESTILAVVQASPERSTYRFHWYVVVPSKPVVCAMDIIFDDPALTEQAKLIAQSLKGAK